MATDPPLPPVFDARIAAAAGLTRSAVHRRVRNGSWIVLRRGAFCTRLTWQLASRRERHLLRAQACLLVRDEPGQISHLSAAALHRWPLPLGDLPPVTLTTSGAQRATRYLQDLTVLVASLTREDLATCRGLPVTAPARTVADCLRHLAIPDAVAIADHALRVGAADPDEVTAVMTRQHDWPHALRARAAAALVDARRESWLESWSLARLALCGVELPEPQVTVLDADGHLIGCVDGLWLRRGTVAESDGRGKYLSKVDPRDADDPTAVARAAARAVMREKEREDALRGVGLEVVRWGTRDAVRNLPALKRRIQRAWERGDPSRFTGRLVFRPPPTPFLPDDAHRLQRPEADDAR